MGDVVCRFRENLAGETIIIIKEKENSQFCLLALPILSMTNIGNCSPKRWVLHSRFHPQKKEQIFFFFFVLLFVRVLG